MSQLLSQKPKAIHPFGLNFREILPAQPQFAQTTSEPEITTGDGGDPDKTDSDWIPDDDDDDDDE